MRYIKKGSFGDVEVVTAPSGHLPVGLGPSPPVPDRRLPRPHEAQDRPLPACDGWVEIDWMG